MPDNRPLSPQGYNIKDEPLNNNPFWGDDGSTDPTIYTRLTQLENDVDTLDRAKADKTELASYVTTNTLNSRLTTLGDLIANNSANIVLIQNDITALKGRCTDLEGDMTTVKGSLNTLVNTTIPGINTTLGTKANQSDLTTLSGTVSNQGTRLGTAEGNITDLQTRMTAAEGDIDDLETLTASHTGTINNLQTALNGKADAADVYTKSEVYSKLETYSNTEVYNKTEVYTKQEVDDLIAAELGSINTILEVILNGNNNS